MSRKRLWFAKSTFVFLGRPFIRGTQSLNAPFVFHVDEKRMLFPFVAPKAVVAPVKSVTIAELLAASEQMIACIRSAYEAMLQPAIVPAAARPA
eukprot:gene4593-14784_t